MKVRAGTGWQYLLADLSLILFIVTAAALSQTSDAPAAAAGVTMSPQGEAMAVYRADAGAPPLGEWLQDQPIDLRQQLTIVAQYAPGRQAEALGRAETLAREAGAAGARARIVVEPGAGGVTASLAFDAPEATSLAQGLHKVGAK